MSRSTVSRAYGIRGSSVLVLQRGVLCFAHLKFVRHGVKLFLLKTTINGPPARSLGFHRPVRVAEDFSICILLADPERLCADAIGMTLIWFQVTGIASAVAFLLGVRGVCRMTRGEPEEERPIVPTQSHIDEERVLETSGAE